LEEGDAAVFLHAHLEVDGVRGAIEPRHRVESALVDADSLKGAKWRTRRRRSSGRAESRSQPAIVDVRSRRAGKDATRGDLGFWTRSEIYNPQQAIMEPYCDR
jgi:hypothetical protein